MTNAQKWIASFLVLFILLLVLSKMTNRQGSIAKNEMTENVEPVESQSATINVENLLANNKCFTCHGRDLNGSSMGPSLAKVIDNWKKPSLVSYLQNPKAFLNNPRMVPFLEKYSREMPAIDMLSKKELEVIADYLLIK